MGCQPQANKRPACSGSAVDGREDSMTGVDEIFLPGRPSDFKRLTMVAKHDSILSMRIEQILTYDSILAHAD